jgi:hypothetical protein
MAPPADTLALNPYSRPQSSVRPGEVPRGAQRLSELRQTPGGGRDYYASPNGSVYRRMNNNWYRREPNGGWSFYASAQARVESRKSPGGNTPQLSPVSGNQPVTRSGAAAPGRNQLGNRGPDAGSAVRAQELATLEREYYARALAQMRAQNLRGSGNYARPARPVGRRR